MKQVTIFIERCTKCIYYEEDYNQYNGYYYQYCNKSKKEIYGAQDFMPWCELEEVNHD